MSTGADQQARWLLTQILHTYVGRPGYVGPHRCGIRELIYATKAPRGLQRQTWELVKRYFFEGHCPIHETAFSVEMREGKRQAVCHACNWRWGAPQEPLESAMP